MSALANFIRHRMAVLNKSQADIVHAAKIGQPALSNILTKKNVRPVPRTIKGLAKALEVEAPLLTSLLGYPTEPIADVDERLYEVARQLLGAPWLADRVDDLIALPREEFDELMDFLDHKRRRNRPGGSGKRSKL